MHMEHLDRLPSPKRETRTPPKSRPVREEDVFSMLEKVQMEVVAHAKKEVARQVEVTNNNMQAKLEGQVFASKDVKTYTAPDGEVFSEEQKYKKYMYQNFYSFKDKEGEKCVKVSGEITTHPDLGRAGTASRPRRPASAPSPIPSPTAASQVTFAGIPSISAT